MKILLKISGESLKGKKEFGIDTFYVEEIAKKIEEINKLGHEISIVVGGGNIYRGGNLIDSGVNPSDSHSLSMLSTVFNGVILKNFLEKIGIKSVVMSPLGINFIEEYSRNKALFLLKKGYVIILTGGTGNPFFTTDTGGVLRAIELGVDIMIKATRVNGVYNKDPEKYSNAKFIEKITYEKIIKQNLQVMDMTSIILAKENNLNLIVVNINDKKSIIKAINQDKVGTIISN